MGYFSNGSEADVYQEQYCFDCINWRDLADGRGVGCCPIWDLHMLFNYEECNKEDSFLHQLIPLDAEGFNQQCTMYQRGKMTESPNERLGLPSASPWHCYELCAGRWQLEQEARRLNQSAHQDSPEARRGKRIHAFLAGVVDEDGSPIKLDDSEQTTADLLQERAAEQVKRIFSDESTLELFEKRLWLTVNGQKAASGRFDRCVYTREVALVQDFKTGWAEPVQAEQNAQLKVLAVLAALHMPSSLREVIVQIVSGPFGVTEARYDLAKLALAYNEILGTLRSIHDPLAPLNPGVEQCKRCPANLICQPCRGLLSPPAKFQTTTLPLEPDRAAKLLDEVAILEGVFEEVKKFYYNRLANDPTAKISGYELVPGAEEREILDWKTAKLRLGEYLDADQLELAASYGIGKIETALAKVLKVAKAQAKEKFNAILGDLVQLKQKKASLKRVSAKGRVVVELP